MALALPERLAYACRAYALAASRAPLIRLTRLCTRSQALARRLAHELTCRQDPDARRLRPHSARLPADRHCAALHVSVSELLARGTTLRQVARQIPEQLAWSDWLRARLPDELAAHLVNAIPKGSAGSPREHVLLADSGVWCARLRYAIEAHWKRRYANAMLRSRASACVSGAKTAAQSPRQRRSRHVHAADHQRAWYLGCQCGWHGRDVGRHE